MSEEMIEVIPENEIAENQDLFNQDGKKGVELSLEEQELLLALHKKAEKSSKMAKTMSFVQYAWAAVLLVFGILAAVLKFPAATVFLVIGIVYALANLILGSLTNSRGKVESYFCSPAIKREPICIVSHHGNKVVPIVLLVVSIVFLAPGCIVAWVFDNQTRAFVAEEANSSMFLAMEQRTLETQKY